MSLTFYTPQLLVNVQRDYNPDTGASFLLEYAGTEDQMVAIAVNYEKDGAGAPIGYGYKTTLIKASGQVVGLTVRIPDDILFTERWCRGTEIVPINIWGSEIVRQSIPALAAYDLTSDAGRQDYMQRIRFLNAAVNAIEAGSDFMAVFTGGTNGGAPSEDEKSLLLDITRYTDHVEIKRPVLRRQRVVPFASAAHSNLFGPEWLYTTDDLVTDFNMPLDIYNLVKTVTDGLPTALPNTAWAWKARCDDVDVMINSGKFNESVDFVFDLWSTFRNPFAP